MANTQQKLGERVRTLRKAERLSQQRFGEMIGMDKTCICDIGKGRRNISLSTLEKISAGFGISMSELLEGI